MLKRQTIAVHDVYVPVKRRHTLDPQKVEALAESMLLKGQEAPILVRADGKRFVLVEGLHRLEACRALGEATIFAGPDSLNGLRPSAGEDGGVPRLCWGTASRETSHPSC